MTTCCRTDGRSSVSTAPVAVLMPPGSKLLCTAHFDNSESNLSNPDPTATVTWGDQTWEEMMIGFYTFTRDAEQATTPEQEEP